jgi:Xaa-Pro aminopeptidase
MRIEKLIEAANRKKLDAIVATSFENVRYLSGVAIHTQHLIPQRLAALIVPVSNADPSFVVCTIEESLIQQESKIRNIIGYHEFKDSPIALIAGVLNDSGLPRGKIGIEMNVFTARQFNELSQYMPNIEIIPVDDVFDQMRMIKDPEEIQFLGKISTVTDNAIRTAYETAKVGDTEIEVLHTLTSILIENGAESLPFLNLGAGKNEVHTHPNAGKYKLSTGDLIGCDVGGRWQGYFSDLARTAVVGKATQHQREVYKNLWEIHEDILSAVRPGVLASDLYWHCYKSFEDRGMKLSLSHIGHSLGLVLHERPILSPAETLALQKGMVLAIEPATRDSSGKYHTEDLIEVTEDGYRLLSRSADWSELLVVG